MNETRNYRVILNLKSFFHDHRCIARIFVNEETTTIRDLEDRIKDIFNIENFYLTSQNQFLPPSEDVRILQKDDVVCVQEHHTLNLNDAESQNNVIHNNEIQDDCIPLKNKKKKKKNVKLEEIKTTVTLTKKSDSEHEREKRKRKEKKRKYEEINETMEVEGDAEEPIIKNYLQPVEEVTDDKSNKNVTSLKQEEYCCKGGNILTYKRNTVLSPITHTYLKERQINIVKINVIKPSDEKTSSRENLRLNDRDFVKKLILHKSTDEIKELVKPENKTTPLIVENEVVPLSVNDQVNTSNVEELPRDSQVSDLLNENETEQIANEICDNQLTACIEKEQVPTYNLEKPSNWQEVIAEQICNEDKEPKTHENEISQYQPVADVDKRIRDVQINNHENNVSVNNIGISQLEETTLKCYNSTGESCENTSQTKTPISFKRSQLSVGSFLEQIKSNLTDSTPPLVESTNNHFITNRRKRVRNRKKKVNNATPTIDLNTFSPVEHPIEVKPMKTEARPLIHIKFGDKGESIVGVDDKQNFIEPITIEKKPHLNFDQDFFLKDENIHNQPSMKNILPKVGNHIAFKVLRITENYTPEVSSYIIGKVVDFNSDNEQVVFDILHGLEQCLSPKGKLSLSLEVEEEEVNMKREFMWVDLLDPRLLFS